MRLPNLWQIATRVTVTFTLLACDCTVAMPLSLPPPRATSGFAAGTAEPVRAFSAAVIEPISSEPLPTPLAAATADALPSKQSTSGLSIPPPKTKAKLALQNGPKKFVLDLPKPSRRDESGGGPSAKRAKLDDLSLSNVGLGGLRGLLPEPKLASAAGSKLPEPKTKAGQLPRDDSATTRSTSLVPNSLKGKQKAAEKVGLDEPVKEVEQPTTTQAPELDIFGLGRLQIALSTGHS